MKEVLEMDGDDGCFVIYIYNSKKNQNHYLSLIKQNKHQTRNSKMWALEFIQSPGSLKTGGKPLKLSALLGPRVC